VICVEARHMRAVLKAQINKTDRNDARGVAQMSMAMAFDCSSLRWVNSMRSF
jgi:transposase